jgi:rhodanese-related sulfurtransferase
VVYCHHGVRSQMAIGVLRMAGFQKLHNLTGGIDAWSVEVDGQVPRY